MFNVSVERKNEKDYDGIIKRAADRFLPLAGDAVLTQAVRLVPVDTGNLKGSLTNRVVGMTAEVGTNVEYAEYVEYGTRRSVAKPYLRPAIDLLRKKLIGFFKELVKQEATRG